MSYMQVNFMNKNLTCTFSDPILTVRDEKVDSHVGSQFS